MCDAPFRAGPAVILTVHLVGSMEILARKCADAGLAISEKKSVPVAANIPSITDASNEAYDDVLRAVERGDPIGPFDRCAQDFRHGYAHGHYYGREGVLGYRPVRAFLGRVIENQAIPAVVRTYCAMTLAEYFNAANNAHDPDEAIRWALRSVDIVDAEKPHDIWHFRTAAVDIIDRVYACTRNLGPVAGKAKRTELAKSLGQIPWLLRDRRRVHMAFSACDAPYARLAVAN